MTTHQKEIYKCFIIWFFIGVGFGYALHGTPDKCQVELGKGNVTTVTVGEWQK